MAIKNTAKVYIDGILRSSHTVLPLKWGDFLDERLDECHLSLRAVKKQTFQPLTPVEIEINNELYFKRNQTEKLRKQTKYYVVANDVATETQIGSGLYNHDLTLIEVTKVAECYVVDTTTITNDLGRSYTANAGYATTLVNWSKPNYDPTAQKYCTENTANIYKTAYDVLQNLALKPIADILVLFKEGTGVEYGFMDFKLSVTYPTGDTETLINEGSTKGHTQVDINLLQLGTYSVKYEGQTKQITTEKTTPGQKFNFTYNISVVENKLPLKKWTVTDVVNRLLDLAEPIRKGEVPRFRFNQEQAAQFDKVLSPQFSFTKQTLRECLQEVGRFIHGEPRLTPKKDLFMDTRNFASGICYLGGNPAPYSQAGQYFVIIDNQKFQLKLDSEADGGSDDWYLEIIDSDYTGSLLVYDATKTGWYYEVSFEMYARQDKAGIYIRPYIKETVSQVIDSYTSYLDSSAENLVNQLDKYSGVIVEPYRGGAQSVRTENAYVRIEGTNMLIATRYPIYSVEKLEYIWAVPGALNLIDITPYLFEKSVYDTQLSSYQEQYPYSKAYGLYYSQGSKNIGGLNFHVTDATGGVFKNYAIVNIVEQVAGITVSDFPTMSFRVTYTPFYNARVAQTHPYYKDHLRPAALIYNQQANVVENRYYGEHLKGAVARLGNVDKSLTYILYNINHIPKAGQMFDRDYYISAVAVEMLPTCFLVTIGLSKDFNRLSAYIGINSEKRYSEISQTQAVERNTLYREYIVIGRREKPDRDSLIGNNLLEMIADTFTNRRGYTPLSNVCAWGTSFKGNDIPGENAAINLPVISSAFGNSISFSWKYDDNYSAGPTAVYRSSGNVKGYFQNSAPYTDYYGRLYYYNFDLQARGTTVTSNNLAEISQGLPGGTKPTQSSGYVSTIGQQPYVMRKDNREALQVNFQIDFVTNLDNLIIGSALASYCPAVRGTDTSLKAKLYVFDTELNKFTDHVEAYENVDLDKMESADVTVSVQNGYFIVNAGALPKTESGATKGKSWAIITNQYKKSAVQVEDEFGNISTQQEIYGGDLLIGQNIEVTAGQTFTPIYFTVKREIFDKTVWKDRR